MTERTNVRIHPTAEVSPDARHRCRAPASGTRPRCASVPGSAPAASSARTCTSTSTSSSATDVQGPEQRQPLPRRDRRGRRVHRPARLLHERPRCRAPSTADGSPKTDADWEVSPILVRRGAALGANSTILPGHHHRRWAMVGAGQRGDPRRGRPRAGGRQPGATARERLPVRRAAARRRRRRAVPRALPALRRRFPPEDGA